MAKAKYPIGIETFSKIREEGYLYVDKTEFVQRLVADGGFFFLSRPRRFGKSLLLSTIEAYYEGRRDLFEGLAISKYPHDWRPQPVFRLNFVNFDTGHIEGLRSTLEAQISHWEQIYGSDPSELDYGQRFYGVIRRAYERTGEKVAILIDEYDKPLFSTIDRPELNNRFREILKSVYGTLKAADRYIRFALVTGVTRFSRLSIFSDINNLRDISLSYDYAAICGITEDDMLTNCSEGIECFAMANSISYEEAFRKLKDNYDGYHFAAVSPDIYNPFSLFNALTEYKIKEYWFSTGTPTFLLKILREQRSDLKDLFDINIHERFLNRGDSPSTNPIAFLFDMGYLTIKGNNESTEEIRLGIPNPEVQKGFSKIIDRAEA